MTTNSNLDNRNNHNSNPSFSSVHENASLNDFSEDSTKFSPENSNSEYLINKQNEVNFSNIEEIESTEKIETSNLVDTQSQFSKWEKMRLRILVLASMPAFLSPGKISAFFSFINLKQKATNTIYLPSLPNVIQSLNSNEFEVSLSISIYTLLAGFMPIIYGPISDRYGRKKILIFGLTIYIISSVLCGISPNVVYLIMFRIFQAFGASSANVVGAGMISDVYPPSNRGNAMGWYTSAALIGPVIFSSFMSHLQI